ncbi:hypothetical protein VNO78_11623 [Psophocarpus tetragonolobus]|uniref:Uncharacterized protein n=1 Tax=Psophocarpus tetragonolobus TaxID=3891 RepID=A0AAN9XP63_PSOTE
MQYLSSMQVGVFWLLVCFLISFFLSLFLSLSLSVHSYCIGSHSPDSEHTILFLFFVSSSDCYNEKIFLYIQ